MSEASPQASPVHLRNGGVFTLKAVGLHGVDGSSLSLRFDEIDDVQIVHAKSETSEPLFQLLQRAFDLEGTRLLDSTVAKLGRQVGVRTTVTLQQPSYARFSDDSGKALAKIVIDYEARLAKRSMFRPQQGSAAGFRSIGKRLIEPATQNLRHFPPDEPQQG